MNIASFRSREARRQHAQAAQRKVVTAAAAERPVFPRFGRAAAQ